MRTINLRIIHRGWRIYVKMVRRLSEILLIQMCQTIKFLVGMWRASDQDLSKKSYQKVTILLISSVSVKLLRKNRKLQSLKNLEEVYKTENMLGRWLQRWVSEHCRHPNHRWMTFLIYMLQEINLQCPKQQWHKKLNKLNLVLRSQNCVYVSFSRKC